MNNKLITKAVLLLSGLALTLSAFTACVDDDAFATVESNVAELETTVSGNAAQLKQIESELQALATSIKATADAAATQSALEDAIAALEAADTTKAATSALATLKTTLEAALQANADADAATKTAIETAVAAVKATADAAATAADLDDLAEELTAAKTAVEAAYAAADAALSDRIDALVARVDGIDSDIAELNNAIGDLNDADETVTALLQVLRADVDALLDAQTVDAFVAGYNLATKILAGEITVDDFGGNEEVYLEFQAYSLANFRATVKLIETRKDWYVSGTEYDDFMDMKDTVEFFLTRAATKEAVKELFTEFNAHVDGMSTLTELWDAALSKIEDEKLVTEEPDSYLAATEILAAIGAVNANGDDADDIDTTSNEFIGLMARYETVVAAQENLVAAFEAVDLYMIPALDDLADATDPFFKWNYSEPALEAAATVFEAIEEGFFSDDDLVALYDETVYTAALIIGDDYEILTDAQARFATLDAANNAKPEIHDDIYEDVVYFGDTYYPGRPLWNELDLIVAAKAEIDAWIDEYDLEDANVSRLYTGDEGYFSLEGALAYATAMNDIYETQQIATLVANIEALNATLDGWVSFADYGKSVEYRNALNTLKASIEAVDNYSSILDENYDTMVGDVLADFAEIEAIMADLKAADDAIQALLTDEMYPMVGNVGYQDYPTIDGFLTTIVDIADVYGIVLPEEDTLPEDLDPNYALIIEEAVTVYETLVAEYEAKTALVAEVYTALYNSINGDLTLADGNEVWENNKKVIGMPTALGVGNTDIDLTVIIDDAEIETNLKDIMDTWFAFAADYKAFCDEAAAEAIAVNNAIEALGDADDLNNYAAIKAAVASYEAWAEDYLADDAIADIQAIKILNTETVYVFVVEANYTDLYEKDALADTTKALAETAFATVDATFATAEAWDIHSESDFDAADEAWTDYVDTYYAGAKVADLFLEDAEYATYEAAKTAFFAELALAEADRDAIADLIVALPALADIYDGTVTTADATAAAEAVYAAIEAYETAYGCDITACTEWDALSVADQTTVKLVAEYAAFVEAYNASGVDAVDFFNSAYQGFTSADVDSVQDAINTGIYWTDILNTL